MRPFWLPAVVAAATALLFGFSGCGGARRSSEQIMLYWPGHSESAARPDTVYPFNLKIKQLDLNQLYDKAKVVTRLSDYSVKFSRKASWAIRPNISATRALQNRFSNAFRFNAVGSDFSIVRPDYIVDGEIIAIEDDWRGGTRQAHITLQLTLTRDSDRKILLDTVYNDSRACRAPGYTILARALSDMTANLFESFVQDAAAVFNRELKRIREKDQGKSL